MNLKKTIKALATGLSLAIISSLAISTPVFAVQAFDYTLPSTAIVGTSITLSCSGEDAAALAAMNGGVAAKGTVMFKKGSTKKAAVEFDVNADGTFSFTYPLDSSFKIGNEWTAVVNIKTSASPYNDSYSFKVVEKPHDPEIQINKTKVTVGDVITVSGINYTAGNTISFKIDETAVNTTATVNSDGTFSHNLDIPTLANGTHKITVIQGEKALSKEFNMNPTAEISITSGVVGSTFTAKGKGFAADSDISVALSTTASLDNAIAIGTAKTDAFGTFENGVCTVPQKAAGKYYIIIYDSKINSVNKQYEIKPSVSFSSTEWTFGDTVTISGVGFTAGSKVDFVTKQGTISKELNLPVDVDDEGCFTFEYDVPAFSAGTLDWTIFYAPDTANKVNTTTVNISPWLDISYKKGGVLTGDPIAISGACFKAKTPIKVYIGEEEVAKTETDENGSFSAQFGFEGGPSGTYEVRVTDGKSTKTVSFKSSYEAGMLVTAPDNRVVLGAGIDIYGEGYLSNTNVSIVVNEKDSTDERTVVTIGVVKTDAKGAFKTKFYITDDLTGGDKTVTLSDGVHTYSQDLYIENTAPAAPTLAVPVSGSRATQPITFQWYGVQDPSGVVYEFQLSTDSGFKNLITINGKTSTLVEVNKLDLTASDAILVNGEKYTGDTLPAAGKDAPYYWRVRAIDGLDNVGNWSTPFTYTVGFTMPDWIIHVWYGIGIVVALILGLIFGRKLAYRSY